MVVGHGMMAKAFNFFENNDQVVIFASGVSNSLETRPEAFQREQSLIEKTLSDHPDKLFVYFSTCSIYDPSLTDSPYPKHKLTMESLISSRAPKYLILRVSQVVGHTNSPTLINFFYNKIMNEQAFEVHTLSYRNLIDVEDVFKIVCKIIELGDLNRVINVASSISASVVEIVRHIEGLTKKKGEFTKTVKGANFNTDLTESNNYALLSGVIFNQDYPYKIINKYYSKFKTTY